MARVRSSGMSEPPPAPRSLAETRRLAAGCRRCPLWRNATQTVFGEGPARAPLMLVGEQPGDREDLAGRPFVGPAGAVLDRALAEAGLPRAESYVTNAVKHFKNVPRGKRRLHQRPTQGEIEICRWWLDRELRFVRPRLVVALGASAAQALLQRRVTVGRLRGQTLDFRDGIAALVTVHPSYVLRQRDEVSRRRVFAGLAADLAAARDWLRRTA